MITKQPTSAVHNPITVLLSLQTYQEARLVDSANNLANAADNPGFKSQMIVGEEVSYPTPKGPVSYIMASRSLRNTSDGSIKMTGNPMDIAVTGKGYFQVMTSNGVRLTRNGQFQVNDKGQLVTPAGDAVLSDGGSEITVGHAAGGLKVDAKGNVRTVEGVKGKLGVVIVDDEQALRREANGYYETQQEIKASDHYRITQGGLEMPNVDAVGETVRLMEIMRLYQQSMRLVELINDQKSETINVKSQMNA